MIHNVMICEQEILLWIQNNVRNDVLTPIFKGITTLGNGGAIWLILSVGLLFSKKTRHIGILSLCALGMSFIINNVMLKNLIARGRPYDVIEGLNCLIQRPTDYSFPSGHTGSSFASGVVLFLGLPKKYSVLFLVLAGLIGFSRLYVGVHYPSDVLGGAVIGTVIAISVYVIGMVILLQLAGNKKQMKEG